jgi:hypothetical protein
MNSRVGKIWKQWPRQVKENNLAIVRANGRLYELQLIRHNEGKLIGGVLKLFNQKYGQAFPGTVSIVVIPGYSN